MLPQNTFLIRQTEKLESESSFINILCPQLIGFVDESFFDKTIFINSSPGGGKTTLLKTFSPDVLSELRENHEKETYKDSFKLLSNLGVIDENRVKLLSINVSCARENYGLIDDLYDNGKAVQVFFQLLSLRILRRTLEAVLKCNQLDSNELNKITFKNIPEEWKVIVDKSHNGEKLYQWTLDEERTLCHSIEEMSIDIKTSMLYNNLSILSMIGNGNILLSGQPIEQKMLVMFDDIHALSAKQRELLRNVIFMLRPNLAIWMTQRSVALSKDEIFGNNGQIHREYTIVNINEYVQQDKPAFYKALKNVADRRVAICYKDEGLEDKLEKELSKESKKKLETIKTKICTKIDSFCKGNQNYTNLYDYLLEKEFSSELEGVIAWQVLLILIEREQKKDQYVWPFINIFGIEEYETEFKKLKKEAEYLVRYHYKLPIYYGMHDMQVISSNNVEQFLDFAGEIFEYRIALDYASKRKKGNLISQEEQEKVLTKCAEEKWEDILRTFSRGTEIQNFISNIAKIGIEGLEKNTASYSGGTFTGIGIKSSDIRKELEKSQLSDLMSLLKVCVAYNLLSVQDIKHGNAENDTVYKVFYLNRWICVKFRLPLGYGGWKALSIQSASALLDSNEEEA